MRNEEDKRIQAMQNRIASIKETGEELSQAEWERFDAAVAAARVERRAVSRPGVEPLRQEAAIGRGFSYEDATPILRP